MNLPSNNSKAPELLFISSDSNDLNVANKILQDEKVDADLLETFIND